MTNDTNRPQQSGRKRVYIMHDESVPRMPHDIDTAAATIQPLPENVSILRIVRSEAPDDTDTQSHSAQSHSVLCQTPEQAVVLGLVVRQADRLYTIAEVAQETELGEEVAETILHHFVSQGVMQVWSPEDTGEEQTLFQTNYAYLTIDALKGVDGTILGDMAADGDERAQQASDEIVAKWHAQPPRKKAEDELYCAYTNVQHVGTGEAGRAKLETVKMQALAALDYIEEALAELS